MKVNLYRSFRNGNSTNHPIGGGRDAGQDPTAKPSGRQEEKSWADAAADQNVNLTPS